VAAVAGVAVLPTALTAIRGGHDFGGAMLVATIVASCGIALAVDDPAAATLEASPSTLVLRRGARAAVIGATLLAAWLACALVAEVRGDVDLPMLRAWAAVAAASAGLALALASRSRTDEPVVAGLPAAVGAGLGVIVIGGLNQRFPGWFPRLLGAADGRWLVIALVTAAFAACSTWRR
jgi:hypothetical protein